ncbi:MULTISPECIES: LLM class flavin-dependent oxidoreductase [unclassified Nonomuraea]|uniref:LLM class flavin-dependent oxidoreductase n=1 Tax=unclassified Nonomuraea TaxID=2593643 RepID=UPI0035BF093C
MTDVGVVLPATSAAGASRYDVVASAGLAEDLGFDSVWTVDHLAFRTGILEPVSVLAAVSAVTRRVGLGFSVLVGALRHPAWTAKQLASLQVLSGDRVLLGVGVGGEYPAEWVAAGVPVEERGSRTDALLDVLPALLSGRPARLPAPWDADVPALAPTGAMPPVWIGGRSAAAMERAAGHGDGWLGAWVSPARFARRREHLCARARELGRAEPRAGIAALVHVDDRDPEHARAEAARFVGLQYGPSAGPLLRHVIAGTGAEVAKGLAAFVAAGADQLVLMPAAAGYAAQYRRLAALLDEEPIVRGKGPVTWPSE